MKKITLILLPFFIISIIKAQPCTKVNELNRKRHKIDGSNYGHPYTYFNRHDGSQIG